jgi:hypothetical protein
MKTTLERYRKRLQRISEGAILKLKSHQFFPPPELLSVEELLGDPMPILGRSTPIGSMGSCFARHIKNSLESNGYNYIHHGEGKRASHGSAAWERVYNTACIKQEIQRAFLQRDSRFTKGSDGRYYDLCRKGTSFVSQEEAGYENDSYIVCARKAFIESDIFVFTLGLSEVWVDAFDEKVLAEAPPPAAYDPTRHSFKLLSPEENIENLRIALNLLLKEKPSMNVILTVSPIPLRATFFDRSAIVSNCVSKASLLYAAHVICEEFSNVHYFPSYEIVNYFADEPFDWDGRHVTETTVDLVFSLFIKTFKIDEDGDSNSFDPSRLHQ